MSETSSFDSFDDLMRRWDQGDRDAETEIWRRFVPRVIGLARFRLRNDPKLKGKVDPEEIGQSAFRSFFSEHEHGRFHPAEWNEIWKLLACVTRRKCRKWSRYYHTNGRDVDRETTPISDGDDAEESRAIYEVDGREPTPVEVAITRETLDEMQAALNQRQQRILLAMLRGAKDSQIAEQLDCSERSVRRVREILKEKVSVSGDQD